MSRSSPRAPAPPSASAELQLSRDERLRLKSDAHHLEPVVRLGVNGLSDAALAEIDRALNAHELVKVRLPASQRSEREQVFGQVAARLGAARIQLIGRLMVLYRPAPAFAPGASAGRPAETANAAKLGRRGAGGAAGKR